MNALIGAQNIYSWLNTCLPWLPQSKVNQHPVLLIAVATIAGVLLDSCFSPSPSPEIRALFIYGWLLAVSLCLLLLIRARPSVRRVVAMLVFVPFGGYLHQSQSDRYHSHTILQYLCLTDQPTVIHGIVDHAPTLRNRKSQHNAIEHHRSPWQTQIEVEISELRVGQSWKRSNGRVLVIIEGRHQDLLPGDIIEAYGYLCRFPSPSNPGQQDLRPGYRYRDLQARFKVKHPNQIVTLPGIASKPKALHRWLAKFAAMGRDELLRHTSDSAGPLAVAMVLGQRDYIDLPTRDLLLVTGTAHLLSVSGMHLAILVILANLLATVMRLPVRTKIICILLFCLFYTSLTGARPPVIRAAVLVGVCLASVWLRRMNQPINALSVAALMLILMNPGNVLNVGVQLSFLAVTTLVLCARKVAHDPVCAVNDDQDKRLGELIDTGRSRLLVLAERLGKQAGLLLWFSCCVTVTCMPLVWHHFHVVSPISVLVNLLLAPCLMLALGSGVLVIVMGLFHSSLGIIPGWVCSRTLEWMQWVLSVASDVPFGHAWLPAPPGYWVVIFYIFLAASFFASCPDRWLRCIRCIWVGIWISIAYGLAISGRNAPDGTLEATFLDVGHGTCVVLRLPSNEVWVYDCGRLGNESYGSAGIDRALWSMGITRLNGIVLSHADSDHFNALPGLLKRFHVNCVITPPGMLGEPESALIPIRKVIEHYQIELWETHGSSVSSQPLKSGPSDYPFPQTFQILHPPFTRLAGSDNANSLVLHLCWRGRSMILPGDLEPPGTAMLVNRPRPNAGGILMAPHHGSLRMDAASVLEWARPRETIVSGGERARKPEVLEMLSVHGSDVHVTAIVGAIRVQIGNQGEVRVQEWNFAGW
ncbi:MAG: ComEC/Rec2 family competence protein [Rubripirellula sp.]